MNAQPIQSLASTPTVADTGVLHRDALMRGLAATETVVNRLVLTSGPKDITFHQWTDSYEVTFYFSESRDAVRDFAAALDTAVTTTHSYRPEAERIEAHAVVQGVTVRAWTETTIDRRHRDRTAARHPGRHHSANGGTVMTQPANPLAAIESMEASAFRISQVARRMLAAHLPPAGLFPFAGSEGFMRLDVQPTTLGEAQAWAAHLGIELVHTLGEPYADGGGFEHIVGERVIDGVKVAIRHHFLLSQVEWDARQAAAEAVVASTGVSA
ncbi:hypothetical protein [Streptomyces sp. NPDC055036]